MTLRCLEQLSSSVNGCQDTEDRSLALLHMSSERLDTLLDHKVLQVNANNRCIVYKQVTG